MPTLNLKTAPTQNAELTRVSKQQPTKEMLWLSEAPRQQMLEAH